MPDEVSAVTRMYDLTLWLLPHTAKFTRAHRFTLGDRIEEGALETLELLVEASYTRDKRELLRRANRRLVAQPAARPGRIEADATVSSAG
jgi:hypothetical protein